MLIDIQIERQIEKKNLIGIYLERKWDIYLARKVDKYLDRNVDRYLDRKGSRQFQQMFAQKCRMQICTIYKLDRYIDINVNR